MVLGIRSKNRKSTAVKAEYSISVKEIKPWPPSETLRAVQTILLQWENGDESYGSLTSSAADGRIEFNESFRLPVTLHRLSSRKSTAQDSFEKNCLQFNLYEARKDKAAKGQFLGSTVINLADYGAVKETVSLKCPISFKRSSRNMVQSALFVSIQPFDQHSISSTPDSLSKQASLDKDGTESVYGSVNDEETEIATFTDDDDDDVSSHSSRATSSSAFEPSGDLPAKDSQVGSQSGNNGIRKVETTQNSTGMHSNSTENSVVEGFGHVSRSSVPVPKKDNIGLVETTLPSDFPHSNFGVNSVGEGVRHVNGSSSHFLATDIIKRDEISLASDGLGSNFEVNSVSEGVRHINGSSSRFLAMDSVKRDENSLTSAGVHSTLAINSVVGRTKHVNGSRTSSPTRDGIGRTDSSITSVRTHSNLGVNSEVEALVKVNGTSELPSSKDASSEVQDKAREEKEQEENGEEDTTHNVRESLATSDRGNDTKSVQFNLDSCNSNGVLESNHSFSKTNGIPDAAMGNTLMNGKETADSFFNDRAELVSKIEMLEEELREAAAVEASLYAIIAEHGSSTNKVHAPARRLSRFYLHVCKTGPQSKRANAAKTVLSGLVLVSKACGNDVPRLTFWLSNSIVLRGIISLAIREEQVSSGEYFSRNSGEKTPKESFDDLEDPKALLMALENLEAWIFSRIVESVWWQTLTPHMQSAAAKGSIPRKTSTMKNGLRNQEQGNFSIDLWKKAFKDACERLCPLRAGGHECGCLHMLSKMVMEQLVSRLDVAMFNAILRESAEEMPTDPVSDPISDPNVLPIPAGKSSFGAGVQLKNAIGTWSRWLTDLFDIDDNDCPESDNEFDDDKKAGSHAPFKPFCLLNALSDLMMLPSEMLADSCTRKEVCPKFSSPLIKRVLECFVPDEFSPNPVPDTVFKALDEDLSEAGEESIENFPCTAAPTFYSPPTAASLAGVIGEIGSHALHRSKSSLLKKSYTSDDELDELDSPLALFMTNNFHSSPATKGRKVVRYQLLRKVWKSGEE